MSTSDEIDEANGWLLNLPPNHKQRLAAIVVAAVLFIGFGILAPFAATPLPRIDAFIPSIAATISVTDFITSVLLFAHFSIYPSRALLALASGYLFVALSVIANALTYPGAFSPTGLFGAGLDSAGVALFLLAYWFRRSTVELCMAQGRKAYKAHSACFSTFCDWLGHGNCLWPGMWTHMACYRGRKLSAAIFCSRDTHCSSHTVSSYFHVCFLAR